MTKLNLPSGIPMSIRLWLATDEYDHNPDPNTISVTSIIKPIKQILLGMRVKPEEQGEINVNSLIASKMGTAIHNSIEESWKADLTVPMDALGIPSAVSTRIRINPSKEVLEEDSNIIPVYMEQRASKVIDGITISGKYDFLIEGRLEDFKTTSTYTYMYKTNDAKWRMQGSIYRWLNQDKVSQDHMAIQYIFTNWQQGLAFQDPARYPKTRTLEYKIDLMSIAETESYLKSRVSELKTLLQSPEKDMPPCTDEDLWRKETTYKYYKNPAKMTRSTKNFKTAAEANVKLADDGFVGIVVEKKGGVGFCSYCPASPICLQKDEYILDGSLVL